MWSFQWPARAMKCTGSAGYDCSKVTRFRELAVLGWTLAFKSRIVVMSAYQTQLIRMIRSQEKRKGPHRRPIPPRIACVQRCVRSCLFS